VQRLQQRVQELENAVISLTKQVLQQEQQPQENASVVGEEEDLAWA
jgi:hypothetical protein